ncbi:MAG: aminotransferase class III-fold pyridoxal phosphate-dependent enzyme, partial [Desulfobacterales bacterium]|nr:aminotransferase class III-fold pyridoxal phosphate-dependent enzyme [Desulfobacterales bacterium]
MAKLKGSDGRSSLILCRTSKDVVRKGIPIITRGQGSKVFDQDGTSYLDLTAGLTRPVLVGHGRKDLAEAIAKQAAELAYFTPMHFANPRAIELAETLAGLTPDGIDNFLFVCDGSEAVESAMKLAKQYHYCR